jgi:peptidyl-prolyl cis-trans isomerase D
MLETLRRGATTKFAAVIIFFPLIIAFALWGIEPQSRGVGGNTLATVGRQTITPDQFQQAYQAELTRISQQFGRRLTPEQARLFGLEQGVLSRLVGAAALDAKVAELGLTMSDAAVAESIRKDPGFAGLNGAFSKASFDNFLRQNGLSEPGYLALRRKEETREQLTDALIAGAAVPQAAVDLLHRHRAETRVIEFLTVEAAKIAKVPTPDDATLKTFYEANKASFMTPAYRRAALLLLTREQVKAKLAIDDAEIKTAWEQTRGSYDTAETRRLYQLAFNDPAAAEAALVEISKAKTFAEAAEKLGIKASDYDLGVMKKSDLIDKSIADAAFSLKKGETSKPVRGQFRTVILHAADVTPGVTRSFDDVKALVRDRLANERAQRELTSLHDQVENERTAGRTLKEIGDKLGLTFQAIEAIDRSGNGPDGKPVAGVPDAPRVLTGLFNAVQGVEAEAVDLADGGYAWFDVLGITPETQRTFEAAAADVKTRWLDLETGKALTEAAAKLVERALKGETLEALSKEAGGKVERTAAITRTSSHNGLTADGIRQAFALPRGAVSSTASSDGSTRTLFRVLDVVAAPPPTAEQTTRLREELERSARLDTLNTYVGALQQRYGVTVNQQALQQALGLNRQAR